MRTEIKGELILPKLDGYEIRPGIYLIGEPRARPDLGPNKLVCLANVHGVLCTIVLGISFLQEAG